MFLSNFYQVFLQKQKIPCQFANQQGIFLQFYTFLKKKSTESCTQAEQESGESGAVCGSVT